MFRPPQTLLAGLQGAASDAEMSNQNRKRYGLENKCFHHRAKYLLEGFQKPGLILASYPRGPCVSDS